MTDRPKTNHALLRMEDVDRTFKMGEVRVRALENVSLEIREAEILVMVGPSGSGKSTILNIVGGLDSPNGGRVWFRDRELTNFSQAELTRYRRETVAVPPRRRPVATVRRRRRDGPNPHGNGRLDE